MTNWDSAEITGIEITYHPESMFTDTEGVDVEASAARYKELCAAALRQVYPNATVTFQTLQEYDSSRTQVYSADGLIADSRNGDDLADIDHITERVYERFDWIVEASANA